MFFFITSRLVCYRHCPYLHVNSTESLSHSCQCNEEIPVPRCGYDCYGSLLPWSNTACHIFVYSSQCRRLNYMDQYKQITNFRHRYVPWHSSCRVFNLIYKLSIKIVLWRPEAAHLIYATLQYLHCRNNPQSTFML